MANILAYEARVGNAKWRTTYSRLIMYCIGLTVKCYIREQLEQKQLMCHAPIAIGMTVSVADEFLLKSHYFIEHLR